jgi:hypothetical protein
MPAFCRALMLAAAAMQAQTETPAVGNVSFERIRRGLADASSVISDTSSEIPRFRLLIEQYVIDLGVPWDAADLVPDYIRPPRGLYHHEFLDTVTPDEFKSGMLFPGVDVLGPATSLVNSLKSAHRRRQQEKIRKQIEEELRQLEAARKKAGGGQV